MQTIVYQHIIVHLRPLSFKRCQNNAWLSVWIKKSSPPVVKVHSIWTAMPIFSCWLFYPACKQHVPISERFLRSTMRCRTRLSKTASVPSTYNTINLDTESHEGKICFLLKADQAIKTNTRNHFLTNLPESDLLRSFRSRCRLDHKAF